MYCRKCYTNLENVTHLGQCGKCSRPFDPQNPKTFLHRPFPDRNRILFRILATTILGIVVAFLVAWFQLATAIAPIHSM